MKLVKYILMLLVVLISNGSCSNGDKKVDGQETPPPPPTESRTRIINATSEKLVIEVSSNLSLCRSGQLEVMLPNDMISAGAIEYKNPNGRINYIPNTDTSIFQENEFTIPEISNNFDEGLNAGATISFFKSYTRARVGGSFDANKKINLTLAFRGTKKQTIIDDKKVDDIIVNHQERLGDATDIYIYKTVVKAEELYFQYEKVNNKKGFVGLNVETDIVDASLSGSAFSKESVSNSLIGKFLRNPQAVLFCREPITKQEIAKTLERRTPSIIYRVNRKDKGCENDGTSEDRDGSFVNQIIPNADYLILYKMKLENSPDDCQVKFIANTDTVAYSGNNKGYGGRAGSQTCDPNQPIEKIRVELNNCPRNWKVNYKVNYRNSGNSGLGQWENTWKCDYQESGASGRPILALKARISKNGQCLPPNVD